MAGWGDEQHPLQLEVPETVEIEWEFQAEDHTWNERAMLARRQHLYRLMARHRRTGEWVGHTILVADEHRPGVGIQEDTTVLPAHRGHRLGLLLKAKMLLWMRTECPELELIDTWNAESNAAMIAVNEQLGCELVYQGSALQLRLLHADG